MTSQTLIAGATILIVDDTPTNLKVASELLMQIDLQVLTARDGESGLARAKLAQPDLILLDVQMAGIDGFETCRRLKADPTTQAIPVIFTTVLNDLKAKLQGFAAGGVDYIPKPFQGEELIARVKTHVALYRLQRSLQAEIAQREVAEQSLRRANLELQRLAVLDELTQLPNRRRFEEYLRFLWNRPLPQSILLILCDVDYFKRYNDHYGHPAGDHCLRTVARALSQAARRAEDLVARYGGEEFALIIPAVDFAGARFLAEQVRQSVEALALPHVASAVSDRVTISLGGVWIQLQPTVRSADLLERADQALYQAKAQGRNRAIIVENHEAEAPSGASAS